MAIKLQNQYAQPLAQTFLVKERYGVFLKKIEVFFTAKNDTFPITLDIRSTTGGSRSLPDASKRIPGSSVTLNSSQVNVSAIADTATEFVFDEPIYLAGDRAYAFTLKSNDLGDYQVAAATLGEFNLGTTASRVTKDTTVGSMYKMQDGLSYSPDPDTDLKFKIYRAKFTSRIGEARFKAASPPKELLENDPFTGINGDATISVNHPGHGFQVNDRVRIEGLSESTRYNGILGASLIGRRLITAIDGFGYQFEADSAADSDISFGGSGITATSNFIFNIGQVQFEDFQQGNTQITYSGEFTTSKSFAGSETAYGTSNEIFFKNRANFELEDPHVIVNDSNEALHLGGNESTKVYARMRNRTTTDFNSPFIDMQRAQFLAIGNLIDNQDSAATTGFNVPINFVPETDPANGSSLAKHITKPVNLINAANGLKVFFASNRPNGSSVDLYYRTTLDGTDSDILQKEFIFVADSAVPPNDDNPSIFREHSYTIGGEFANTIPTFNQYQIKLVLNSTSSSKVPRITDLRTIALGAE